MRPPQQWSPTPTTYWLCSLLYAVHIVVCGSMVPCIADRQRYSPESEPTVKWPEHPIAIDEGCQGAGA